MFLLHKATCNHHMCQGKNSCDPDSEKHSPARSGCALQPEQVMSCWLHLQMTEENLTTEKKSKQLIMPFAQGQVQLEGTLKDPEPIPESRQGCSKQHWEVLSPSQERARNQAPHTAAFHFAAFALQKAGKDHSAKAAVVLIAWAIPCCSLPETEAEYNTRARTLSCIQPFLQEISWPHITDVQQ